jgi:beta-lactamase class A
LSEATCLDRSPKPGDLRDTTTPAAMLRKLIFGDVLSRSSRAQLAAWMIMNKTGDTKCGQAFPVTS